MGAMMKEEMFLSGKVKTHDLVKVNVIDSPASQVLRATVERIYSARRGIDPRCLGREIEFTRSPGHWGDVSLSIGERALVFVASIAGRLYEDPWHGHMVVDEIDGRQYASFPGRELWLRDDVPASLRAYSKQDPKRPYATAIRLDAMEAYLVKLIADEQKLG